ncbi:MAG: ribbon-helix-helix protein, CopG family [Woeseiaceae bacterium]|nr:ribbon-helix-helix protein, CopG family [Woeseiaceae bacterium]
MAKTKISTLNLRISPPLKEAVREAAAREHRSVANMVEVLIRRHCETAGITIPEQSKLSPGNENG